MKGYLTPYGYMGYLDGLYQLFATENEYLENVREKKGVLYERKYNYN